MVLYFQDWYGENGMEQFIIKYTGCYPFTGAGINFRSHNKTCLLRSVDGTKYYADDLTFESKIQYTLQGKEGNQDENQKKFNEPLLNTTKTEHIYVYRVNPYVKKNKYMWYGKYQIVDKNSRIHPDIHGKDRTIIILTLQKIE